MKFKILEAPGATEWIPRISFANRFFLDIDPDMQRDLAMVGIGFFMGAMLVLFCVVASHRR